MTAREPRFEIVQGDGYWWARFRAANGRVVWATETYQRRVQTVRAVELIVGNIVRTSPFAEHPEIGWQGSEWPTEVRTVDERGQA